MLLIFNYNIFAANVVVVVDSVSIANGVRATKAASEIDQIDVARPNARDTSYNRLMELQVTKDCGFK